MRTYTALFVIAVVGGCESPEPTDTVPSVMSVERFTDIASDTGLDFYHTAGATGGFYFPEIAAGGVALFDYDSDGDLDVFFTQGEQLDQGNLMVALPAEFKSGNRLYRNELIEHGALAFRDVSDESGIDFKGYALGVAVGDIDNDSHPDLYITGMGANALYRNQGDGTFADHTVTSGTGNGQWSASAAFVDFDRDGDLDLFVTNYVNFTLSTNKPCRGSIGDLDYCGPTSYKPLVDQLFRNDGDGTFTDVTGPSGIAHAFGSGLGVSVADFNGDDWPDIYVANDGDANQLWINLQDGTFVDKALEAGTAYNHAGIAEAGMGIATGDFDADGDEDLFVTHLIDETNTLYVNDGNGYFEDATFRAGLGNASLGFTGFGTGFFDFDNDGDLDLFIANGAVRMPQLGQHSAYPYQQQNQLLRNNGLGRFEDITNQSGAVFALREVSRGAAFGDLDNDGDIDIVVANNNGPARLLRNNESQRKGLTLRLVGANGSDAIGARAGLLRTGKDTLWRYVRPDGSYQSANDTRVHFGLGSQRDFTGVVVRWPDGAAEHWSAPVPDTLVQGAGESWPEDDD